MAMGEPVGSVKRNAGQEPAVALHFLQSCGERSGQYLVHPFRIHSHTTSIDEHPESANLCLEEIQLVYFEFEVVMLKP